MQIVDDGPRFVIVSKPWFIGKLLAVLFAITTILFALIWISSLALPPTEVSIDCDRGRGTCDVARSAWHKSIAIEAIDRAEVVRNPYQKNESTSYRALLRTRAGEKIPLTESGYHAAVTDGYRRAVDSLNGFLRDPSQPSFGTHFVADDTDWTTLIVFSVISPIMTWMLFRSWVTRRVEVDRAARTVRVISTRKLRGTTDRTIAFGDIRELSAWGARWLQIVMHTTEGPPEVLALIPLMASGRRDARRILTVLANDLGLAPNVSVATRRLWALG